MIVALFLSNCSSENKENLPKEKPKNPHLQALIKNYVQAFDSVLIATNTPGAGVVIVQDTSVLYLAGRGTKTAFSNDSVDVNTVFRIGSLSKGFGTVLAGILVQNGALKWSDKVKKYVPEFVLKDAAQSERVNLIHLLSQTTGLPYHAYTNLVEAGLDIKNIARQLKDVNLISKEGEIYAYQNASFSLIGSIMEEVKDQPLSEIFEKELFQPLGANNASTDFESITEHDNVAQPHAGGGNSWHPRSISKKYYNAVPAGGVNASIADMSQWLQLLLGNRPDIISKNSLKQIFKPRINTSNSRRYFHKWPMVEDTYYGLGWRILTNRTDTLVYHGGYVNGYRGEILVHPEEKIGICVLVNAPSELASKAVPLFLKEYELRRDSIKAWDGRQLELERAEKLGKERLTSLD
jgi:beta-lactamase class C